MTYKDLENCPLTGVNGYGEKVVYPKDIVQRAIRDEKRLLLWVFFWTDVSFAGWCRIVWTQQPFDAWNIFWLVVGLANFIYHLHRWMKPAQYVHDRATRLMNQQIEEAYYARKRQDGNDAPRS